MAEALREVDERYDPDLWAALNAGGESRLREAAAMLCKCGHARADHPGATGALAGFGGSACGCCWTCGTFRPVDPDRFDALCGEHTS